MFSIEIIFESDLVFVALDFFSNLSLSLTLFQNKNKKFKSYNDLSTTLIRKKLQSDFYSCTYYHQYCYFEYMQYEIITDIIYSTAGERQRR